MKFRNIFPTSIIQLTSRHGSSSKYYDPEPLLYHKVPTPGKFKIKAIKPLNNQKDLSLAYSPGVAIPCQLIAKDPEKAYEYTTKGNCVAVISNGTAVLGLGNIGALAGKPVMEGKAVLFNKFAGVESIDLCVDTQNPDEFINCVKCLAPSFGGINLEDIKGPDCFYIEQKLKEQMNIPVFHDDQHGTAIVCLAGLINACDITKRKFSDLKIVISGAGAAGIACANLILAYGAKGQNLILCDSIGVCYKETDKRTLEQALEGADVFIGVSVAGSVTQEMVKKMNPSPIIFAMANPEPEIRPEKVKEVRPDAIVATGRSDYPNQVNNVMCFPFLFRGALDVRASEINENMKMAAAIALSKLAREPVPQVVAQAYEGRQLEYGTDYIIPTPFDPRLIEVVSMAAAQAAVESGIAKKQIQDWNEYKYELRARYKMNSLQ